MAGATTATVRGSNNADAATCLRNPPESILPGRLPFFIWKRHTPADWIAKGSRDEDCLTRPLNHFYDPYHDAPLGIGAKAPDWALENLEATFPAKTVP